MKGYENKHYFGPACGDNRSIHWYEKYNPSFVPWLEMGETEGIKIIMEGDVFNLYGFNEPHIKTIIK